MIYLTAGYIAIVNGDVLHESFSDCEARVIEYIEEKEICTNSNEVRVLKVSVNL